MFNSPLWNSHELQICGWIDSVSWQHKKILVPVWFATISQVSSKFSLFSSMWCRGVSRGGHWGQLTPIRISVEPLNRKFGPNSKKFSPALLLVDFVVLTNFGVQNKPKKQLKLKKFACGALFQCHFEENFGRRCAPPTLTPSQKIPGYAPCRMINNQNERFTPSLTIQKQ